MVVNGGIGVRSLASKPLTYPASARSRLACFGSYGYGSRRSADSMLLGMIDPVRRENPRRSASLSACLSNARFAASRTRRSLHGDLGVHCSGNSIHQVAGGITLARRSFGSVLMAIDSRPIIT